MPLTSPETIQSTVSIAFLLEALIEKEGCTTRTVDLPGKPLEDFLIAAINAGPAFAALARDVHARSDQNTFAHYPKALRISNHYKSPKTVNFGLCEIMFLVVHGALTRPDTISLFDHLDALLTRNGNDAVQSLLEARDVAWGTSVDPAKRQFDPEPYRTLPSMRAFYTALETNYLSTDSNYQWTHHALHGHPILRAYYEGTPSTVTEMKEQIPNLHRTIRAQFPDIKIGILADMCAAAIFLRLYESV